MISTRALPYTLGAAVVGGTSYYLLRKYVAGGVCRSRASLKGRTVIVTGANAGVGLETAADLAGRGARVIMACRSVERGEKAAVEVRKRSVNNDVVFSQLDLGSLESGREFAERTLKEETHVDVLINNAGVCLPKCPAPWMETRSTLLSIILVTFCSPTSCLIVSRNQPHLELS